MTFDGKTITSSDTVEVPKITLDKNIIFKRNMQNQSFLPYKKIPNQKTSASISIGIYFIKF